MSSFLTRSDKGRVPRMDGRGEDTDMGVVAADDDKCTGCNLCVETCPGSALTMFEKGHVRMLQADLVPCVSCGDCVAICQPGALTLTKPHVYGGFFKGLHRGAMALPRRF